MNNKLNIYSVSGRINIVNDYLMDENKMKLNG